MKNKLIIILISLFFISSTSNAEIYEFNVSKIKIEENGNLVKAKNGTISSKEKGLEITAKTFIYNKDQDKLDANDGFVIIKDEDYKIYFKNIYIQNSVLKASNGIKIEDLEN